MQEFSAGRIKGAKKMNRTDQGGGNEDNERERKRGKEGKGNESPAFAGCNQLPRGQLVTKVNRRRNVRRGLYRGTLK